MDNILYPRVYLLFRPALHSSLLRSPCSLIMFALRRVFTLALVSVACASQLNVRQTTNTNAAINAAVDTLDETLHKVGPTILTLMANQTASDTTIGQQMTALETAFNKTTATLAGIAVSAGSTTVAPTNDDISITYSDVMALTATSLSGIIAQGKVPGFPAMVTTLDPIMAKTTLQLNITSPASLVLVHRMMLDASQFFVAEKFTQTLTALGF
ncbi:POXA3b laccase small subunit [Mycena metata]|uniref:POXA3b laccase small subunit n=1 Tax=Mycena metata TaxID=1033252 RepID=A0AAD7IP64_9AGAR|nr:POXA3b laccase small subunit [Mycena metata]